MTSIAIAASPLPICAGSEKRDQHRRLTTYARNSPTASQYESQRSSGTPRLHLAALVAHRISGSRSLPDCRLPHVRLPHRSPMSAPVLPPFAQATSGALGSAVSNTLVYPLDLLSTRLQTQSRRPGTPGTPGTPGPDGKQLGATPATKPRGYQSLAGALGEIYQKGGVRGLYQGWQSDTLSNTLSK